MLARLSALGVQVIAMENFPPSELDPLAYCRKQVSGSDLFVLILRARYGNCPDGKTSMTRFEYEAAGQVGIERLVFESDESAIAVHELDPADWPRLKEWKEELRRDHLLVSFCTAEELALKVEREVTARLKRPASPDVQGQATVLRGDYDPSLECVVIDDGNAAETRRDVSSTPRISEQARMLFVNAARSPDGAILIVPFLGGLHVQAGKSAMEIKDSGEKAQLQASIHELLSHKLIVDKTGIGESYLVTDKGRHAVDVEMPEQKPLHSLPGNQ